MSTSDATKPGRSWGVWALRLCVVLGVFGASIAAAEWAYRHAGVQVAGGVGGFYEPFGDHGYKNAANSSTFVNWYSGRFHVYTDPVGFRVDADHSAAVSADGSVDILVVGDSQSFGQGLEFEQSLMGQFAELATSNGLSVANAAVGGHFLRNQSELLRWLVDDKRIRPRVVLVCVTPRAAGEPEAYSTAHVEDGELWDAPPDRAKKLRAWMSANSAVYLTIRNAVRNFMGEMGVSPREFFSKYTTGLNQDKRAAALAGVLGEIKKVSASAEAKVVVCYLPLALDAEIDAMAARQTPPVQGVSGRAAAETASSASRAIGAPFIDVSPVLEQSRREGEPITLEGDMHYNARTSRLVAERIYNSVDWRALCRPAN